MSSGKRRIYRTVAVASLALASSAIGFVAWNILSPAEAETLRTEPEVRPVKTLRVEPRPITENRIAIGEIRPRSESDLGFRVSGKLIARGVDAGDTVRKGQLLAEVEDQDYRNKMLSAQADRASAQASLVEARAAEERTAELLKRGYATRANHDAVLKNLRAAEARLKSAKAAFDMAQDQVAYTRLLAEFDGIVTAVAGEPGQIINAGQMIVRLAKPDKKDAVFSVAEAAFGHEVDIAELPAVTVSLLSHPSIEVRGSVREVSPIADAATKTYQVKVSLANALETMRFGASVSGRVEITGKAVIALPGSALFDLNGAPAVWVVTPTSQVHLKPVGVERFETDRVIVRHGLAAGDIVVTAGVNRLRENQKVRFEGAEK